MPLKLLVIGLDSATFDVIEPARQLGRLPNIGRLMDEGSALTLLSTKPPLTPVAWTTMMTGVSAGRHGILDFRELAPGSYYLERSSGTLCRSKQLWRLLSDAGLAVGAYNFPWTDTRPRVNGFLIGGNDVAGTSARCQPRSVAKELQSRFGPAVLDDMPPARQNGEYDMDELAGHVRSLFAVARHLLTLQPLDAFGVNVMAADHVQHRFMGAPAPDGRPHETVLRLYDFIDTAVGELLAWAGDDTIVALVSDHGSGPFRERINVYGVLRDLGFLAFRSGLPAWDTVRTRQRRPTRRRLKALLRPFKAFKRHLTPLWRRTGIVNRLFRTLDWTRTRVFCWGPFPAFRLNVAGREPHGIVPESDYDATCEELIGGLLAYNHPETGEPLFEWAAKTNDLYPGLPGQGRADVLALPSGCGYASDVHLPYPDAPVMLGYEHVARLNHAAALLTGNHRPDGVCILRGPGIRQGATPAEAASILDVLPTLLHLLEVPVPEGLEGRVMASALEEHAARETVYTSCPLAVEADARPPAYSSDEAERVEQRLRDLGYME